MRRQSTRTIACALALGLAVGSLAACSSSNKPGESTASPSADGSETKPDPDSPPDPDSTAAASFGTAEEIVEMLQWEVDSSGNPAVYFPVPLAVAGTAARTVEPGDGEELVEGMLIALDYADFDGTTGELGSSSYGGAAPPATIALTSGQLPPVLFDGIVGNKVGAKILLVMGSEEGSGVSAITIVGALTPLERSEGKASEKLEHPEIPLAGEDANGVPTIEPGKGEPPKTLIEEVLIKGEGPKIRESQLISVHYSGWLWDGTPFDSSWKNGAPFAAFLSQGGIIDGWVAGLAGHTIGSRVELVIPPDLAYGDEDRDPIPPGSTLVFVIDILGAM